MPAAKVTLAAPSGTRAAAVRASDGAAAASAAEAPKPKAAPTIRRGLTMPRAPAAMAPATEPVAIAMASTVYVPAPASKVKRARSGRITWKLKPSVPTRAIIASGISSSGVAAT